ncbi:hypothetical protein AALB_3993 [Agarivorans albus MKT 106]|uniref:Uncharacterized protein n=1 Tax=Agarivorans albus MKT 106 TaxID=1331007 RepID=R9PRL7_AGAAL|nr:hypothetical protein AALB_3993 [Agarivorans albus MKT 106]
MESTKPVRNRLFFFNLTKLVSDIQISMVILPIKKALKLISAFGELR